MQNVRGPPSHLLPPPGIFPLLQVVFSSAVYSYLLVPLSGSLKYHLYVFLLLKQHHVKVRFRKVATERGEWIWLRRQQVSRNKWLQKKQEGSYTGCETAKCTRAGAGPSGAGCRSILQMAVGVFCPSRLSLMDPVALQLQRLVVAQATRCVVSPSTLQPFLSMFSF